MREQALLGECKCCRLHPDVVRGWLDANGIPEGDLARRGLTHLDIEERIAKKDPVVWAYLNFVERENCLDDATGLVIKPRGEPWVLYPVQAKMARTRGNLVVESASEVGKTRDLVLNALWMIDTKSEIDSILIAGDRDGTLYKIWQEVGFQLRSRKSIGGGVVSRRVKPYREIVFRNGKHLEMIMCGHEGQQFRGGHYSAILADEVAKWKRPMQWSELWRGGKAGCEFRIYSTPDGDYSSPFYALCQRAVRIDGKRSGRRLPEGHPDEPKFRKLNISRRDLPTWSDGRAAKYKEQFGPETSVEWRNNVEGTWGSPSYSLFPMDTLKPCLVGGAELPNYRLVVATIDRDRNDVALTAAKLSTEIGIADGVRQEEMLAREQFAYADGKEKTAGEVLAATVAAFFPAVAVREWTSPVLVCGADLGSASEPTEILFVHVVGDVWSDLFRLHLKFGDPERDIAPIFDALDHASGHQAKYSLDSGSFGNTLVSILTNDKRVCLSCEKFLNFSERLVGRGFGNYIDLIDVKTGEPVLDPDKTDTSGNPQPRRASNKEFGTQALERKSRAGELRIAWDGGAGDPSLSGPQLLVNHTATGKNSKGERNFKGVDDHHIDARRQVALAIVAELRHEDGAPSPSLDNVVSLDAARSSHRVFDAVASGGTRDLFQHGGSSSVRGLFR